MKKTLPFVLPRCSKIKSEKNWKSKTNTCPFQNTNESQTKDQEFKTNIHKIQNKNEPLSRDEKFRKQNQKSKPPKNLVPSRKKAQNPKSIQYKIDNHSKGN